MRVDGAFLAAWGLAGMCASALMTAGWIRLAHRRNVLDAPGQRRLHALPTPRGGGVAMALVLLASWAWLLAQSPDAMRGSLTVGTAIAAGIGLLDDMLPVSSLAKFAGQGAAAVLIALALPWSGVPGPLGYALSALFVLVLLNFWNFMDGSNGLVATQTAIVAAAFAWLASTPAMQLVAVATVAACLGFLPFNLPKARVFMGDAGSHVLGATVAILSLSAMRRGEAHPALVGLLLSAFLIDAGLTLAKRIVLGRRFWRAHREHLYQWAVRRGHSHARVCLAYAAWAILCAWIALGWGARGATESAIAALAVGLAGAATWVLLRRHWLRRDTRMDATT